MRITMATRARTTRSATSKTAAKPATKAAPAATDLTWQNFLTELALLAGKYSDTIPASVVSEIEDAADEAQTETAPAKKAAPAKRTTRKPAAKAEPEEDEGDEDDDAADDDGLDKLSDKTLRARVRKLNEYEEEDVLAANRATLLAALRGEELPEDDEAGDEDDDDADDGSGASDDEIEDRRAELTELTVAALKKIARTDHGATGAELKDLDKGGVIDHIIDAEFPEAGDEDGDEDDEGAEGEEEGDGYTEDELAAMSVDELNEIIEEWEIDAPKKLRSAAAYKKSLVKAILDDQDAAEDE